MPLGASNISTHEEFSLQSIGQSFFRLRSSGLLGLLKEVGTGVAIRKNSSRSEVLLRKESVFEQQ